MLVQAQNQKERSLERAQLAELKAKTEEQNDCADNLKNEGVEVKEIVRKDESSDECGGGVEVSETNGGGVDIVKSDGVVELDGNKVIKIEAEDVGDEVGGGEDNHNDISIDPRTYCKLGHFHLLLEEYPKGKIVHG